MPVAGPSHSLHLKVILLVPHTVAPLMALAAGASRRAGWEAVRSAYRTADLQSGEGAAGDEGGSFGRLPFSGCLHPSPDPSAASRARKGAYITGPAETARASARSRPPRAVEEGRRRRRHTSRLKPPSVEHVRWAPLKAKEAGTRTGPSHPPAECEVPRSARRKLGYQIRVPRASSGQGVPC
jgi:hypothetical protein